MGGAALRSADHLPQPGCAAAGALLRAAGQRSCCPDICPEDVGENLYHAGPLHAEGRPDDLFVVTATQVVDAWGAESADYSPVHDACASNRQCGHYTQIVWTTTREVGCGMSVCPTLGQVWVCNYRPRGNIRILR